METLSEKMVTVYSGAMLLCWKRMEASSDEAKSLWDYHAQARYLKLITQREAADTYSRVYTSSVIQQAAAVVRL
jgi:hypothetical protein